MDVKVQNPSENVNEKFEVILSIVNGQGKFSRWNLQLLVMSLLASFSAAMNHLSPIFIAFTPSYQCTNGSELDSCHSSNTTACTDWTYDTSVFHRTVVSEWNLVCNRLALLPTIGSSYMAGVVVGNCFSGFLSDRFGRRTIVLVMSVLHITGSFVTAFATSYPMFVAVRFFVGGSIHSVWSAVFVMIAETVEEEKRVMSGAVLNFGWNIGSLLMTLLAFLLRDWSWIQLSFAVFSISLLSYYFFLPESPRWLIQNHQYDRAKDVLVAIANKNRVNLSQTEFDRVFQEIVDHQTGSAKEFKPGSLSSQLYGFYLNLDRIVSAPRTRTNLMLLVIPWFAVGMCAYGIHFSVRWVQFDIFITTAIKEIVNLAIVVCLMPVFKRVNRTVCLLSFYAFGGVIGLIFLSPLSSTAEVVLYILCQGIFVGNFYLVDTYTPEVLSTDIRNFGFAFCDSMSKIGTTIAPFIVDLGGESNPGLPPAVFGAVMLAASVSFLFLPETRGKPLTQTVEDETESTTSIAGKWLRRGRVA